MCGWTVSKWPVFIPAAPGKQGRGGPSSALLCVCNNEGPEALRFAAAARDHGRLHGARRARRWPRWSGVPAACRAQNHGNWRRPAEPAGLQEQRTCEHRAASECDGVLYTPRRRRRELRPSHQRQQRCDRPSRLCTDGVGQGQRWRGGREQVGSGVARRAAVQTRRGQRVRTAPRCISRRSSGKRNTGCRSTGSRLYAGASTRGCRERALCAARCSGCAHTLIYFVATRLRRRRFARRVEQVERQAMRISRARGSGDRQLAGGAVRSGLAGV